MRLFALLLVALLVAGCGVGPGDEKQGGAELRVTRDFGAKRIGTVERDPVREGDTVMRLLRSRFDVTTRFGGRFVQSIEGLQGKGAGGRLDWFYFVNGIEAGLGAAEYSLNPGDVIQWDYRRWDTTMRVPAIVGAYPEPFRSGIEGRRYPVRVECHDAEGAACREVKDRLRDQGINATGAVIGTTGDQAILRVVVAPWREARLVRAIRDIERGPEATGVFARFRGPNLELLDEGGEVAERAPAGTGLLAALSRGADQTVWVVTGPGDDAVLSAARSLDPRRLRDAYAVASGPDGVRPLPLGR